MISFGRLSIFARLSVIFVSFLTASEARSATHEEVLHSFSGVANGGATTMIFDSAGNLYGTANPSIAGGGVVFKLSPATAGGWTYATVYVFKNGLDGSFPSGRLAIDSAGNLYGTTWQAGFYNCGTAYELSPNSSGWNFSVLHAFTCSDGWGSESQMVFDAAGNLYGATSGGGLYGNGTVFEFTRDSNGEWAYHNIFNFQAGGPTTDLVLDPQGNLYGAGYSGLFELSRQADGSWTETSTYTFNTADGLNPVGRLVRDSAGNLYLTNFGGGQLGYGTALQLSPQSDGTWISTVLHSFNESLQDGRNPCSGLALDSAGNVYGTAQTGGGGRAGMVFKITPNGDGQWTESALYSFKTGVDGYQPQTGLVLDGRNDLYGLTTWGGTSGQGVVFKIVQ